MSNEATLVHEKVATNWREQGVKVVKADQFDSNTAQTPGMKRVAAITSAVGAEHIWAGTVRVEAGAKSAPHHHGALESVIYVLRGRVRMRWGEHLEFVAEAGPGEFIFVPPYVPHQEINARNDEPSDIVLARSDKEPVVVHLDIEPAEKPENVYWIDPLHTKP
jgi:uncharacterized RmlC-like cupin family protein